ncbi:MAG TPA: ATP-binding protein [Rhizobiaceae bacterium]|nr:ATP-binding protein [Rhizobiaceae bacterium]
MAEEQAGDPRARIGTRLWHARWTLAAAAVALAATVLSPWSGWIAAAGFVLVLAATLFSPRRSSVERAAARQAKAAASALEGLSGERLAAAVPDPLIVFDRRGVVVHANASTQMAFAGIQPGIDLQLRFRAPEMQALIQQVLEGGSPETIEYAERLPIERLFRITARPVGEGSVLNVIIFRDQSEARRIDRMRADFIANASHELRTPLATISGFIETLRGPAREDPAARERFLGIMHSQTLRMARLIDDLLSLSRIEMTPFVGSGDMIDLKTVVGSVIDALNPLATELGMTIRKDFADDAMMVQGSRDQLFQVFENLIENACKYGQSGGRVDISLAVVSPGGKREAEVTVRDYGPGIAEEHIPRVTERFYRVDAEASRTQKGTGLGLSIVKHILTRHHGRLSIRSTLGEGATFTVHLPLS